MSTTNGSSAVAAARAHVQAWSTHDFDTARAWLADGVHIIAITTQPGTPQTDLHGADAYMAGLVAFAQSVVPGSARIVSSLGDERNALLTVTVEVDFGAGPLVLPGARLYLFDDSHKIITEQVVFYACAK